MLGELEKEIMDLIWGNKQPLTVRAIYDSLKKKRPIAYTTVMTVMNRLVEKKMLKRLPEGKAYIYKTVYSKDKFLTKMSRQLIKNFTLSFGPSAIANFTQEIAKISPEKKAELIKALQGK